MRDPVLHRDARRAARLARLIFGYCQRRRRSAPLDRRSACSAAGRRARSANGDGSSARSPASRSSSPVVYGRRQRGATASRCGRCGPRSLSARIGCARHPRRRLRRQFELPGRPALATQYAEASTASPSRRAASRSRPASRCRPHRHRGHDRHDLPGHPAPFRAQRLRHTAATRCRRAGRHQHPLDDHADLHPDGPPVRASAPAVQTARLNGGDADVGVRATSSYVIAAAVIGGTSFAGGIGTIPGAVLGAVVMQSLPYGLSFNAGRTRRPRTSWSASSWSLAVGFDAWYGAGRLQRGGSTMTAADAATATADAHAAGRDAQHPRLLRRRPRRRRRDASTCDAGRGRRPGRRQRRRQVDADEGAVRRAAGRLGRDPDRRQAGRPSPTRATQRPTGSSASTRPWRWPTTSTRPRTCSSAASS